MISGERSESTVCAVFFSHALTSEYSYRTTCFITLALATDVSCDPPKIASHSSFGEVWTSMDVFTSFFTTTLSLKETPSVLVLLYPTLSRRLEL